MKFEFPHGWRVPNTNVAADVSGKFSVAPNPVTSGATAWSVFSWLSGPRGVEAKTLQYGPATFVQGQNYTVTVTESALDGYDRPFAARTFDFRISAYGNPGLGVTVNPASPVAASTPTFSWVTTDYERFNVDVYKGASLYWNRGLGARTTSSVVYAGTALTSGSYTVTLYLYDACNALQNSVSQGFVVP